MPVARAVSSAICCSRVNCAPGTTAPQPALVLPLLLFFTSTFASQPNPSPFSSSIGCFGSHLLQPTQQLTVDWSGHSRAGFWVLPSEQRMRTGHRRPERGRQMKQDDAQRQRRFSTLSTMRPLQQRLRTKMNVGAAAAGSAGVCSAAVAAASAGGCGHIRAGSDTRATRLSGVSAHRHRRSSRRLRCDDGRSSRHRRHR